MTSPRRHSKRSPSIVVAPLPLTAAYILLAVVGYGAVLTFGANRIMCSPMVSMAGLPSSTWVPNWPAGVGAAASRRFSVSLNGNTNDESLVGGVLLDAEWLSPSSSFGSKNIGSSQCTRRTSRESRQEAQER